MEKKDCPHEEFRSEVKVGRFLDIGKFMADVTVWCAVCGEKFRFKGLPAGLDFDNPMVSVDGLELRAPIEPEGERALHNRVSFVVPKIPTRN